MQGLVDFASQVGEAFAILIPTFCYLAAAGVLSVCRLGVLDAVASAKPFFRPPLDSVPVACAFGRLCEFRQDSQHGARDGRIERHGVDLVPVELFAADRAGRLDAHGASPSATLVNIIVTLFQAFFQSFGAMVVFFALVSWRSVVNGPANRSQMGCVVQFVFGIMLINILAITNALVAIFVA
jgi:hypothetical protein